MIDYKKRKEFVNEVHNFKDNFIVPIPPDCPTLMDDDEICKIVFAPNPNTGFATNPIELRLSRNTERVINEYLDDFLKALPPRVGSESDDEALDLAQPRDLSPDVVNNYYNTLLNYANTTDDSQ